MLPYLSQCCLLFFTTFQALYTWDSVASVMMYHFGIFYKHKIFLSYFQYRSFCAGSDFRPNPLNRLPVLPCSNRNPLFSRACDSLFWLPTNSFIFSAHDTQLAKRADEPVRALGSRIHSSPIQLPKISSSSRYFWVASTTLAGGRKPPACQSRQPFTAQANIPSFSATRLSRSPFVFGNFISNGIRCILRRIASSTSFIIGLLFPEIRSLNFGKKVELSWRMSLAVIGPPPVMAQIFALFQRRPLSISEDETSLAPCRPARSVE